MATQLVSGALEHLHDQSLPTIEMLQATFPDNKDFMISISTFFDPKYVFLVYAPILYAINRRVGHRMVAALTLTEWVNQILKWLLAGERPYWYVHERAHELANASLSSDPLVPAQGLDMSGGIPFAKPLADLKQFPVTCELGAGSPSGHAMVTATVWYILIDAYHKGELNLYSPTTSRDELRPRETSLTDKLAKLSWSMYTLILVLVSLSRVYLACHFPHQCLCGAILGVVVARFVLERLPMERLTKAHYCLATAGMFIAAMSTYALLRSMGVNPLWSVDKAMRWCVKKEYIHLDTTPFYSMTRYLGFCFGAGLAYNQLKAAGQSASSQAASGAQLATTRVLAALASIAFGQMLLALPMPKSNLNLFYVISFAMYSLFTYSIAGPIPTLVKGLTQSSQPRVRAQ